jgi:hypothetical protein
MAAPAIPRNDLDLEDLRAFLLETKASFTDSVTDRANWTRLVCYFDYLRFGLQLE